MVNTDSLNRIVFVSDNLPFLQALDSESIALVCIDPPFGKSQTFIGRLTPPLTESELRIEREMMDSWEVYDPASAYELGVEYPDQIGERLGGRRPCAESNWPSARLAAPGPPNIRAIAIHLGREFGQDDQFDAHLKNADALHANF